MAIDKKQKVDTYVLRKLCECGGEFMQDKNDDMFISLFINGLNGLNSKNIVKHICDKCNKEERFDDIYPKIIYQYEK